MYQGKKVAAIIVAAGSGSRAGRDQMDRPKQYRPISGVPLLKRTLQAFLAIDAIDFVVPVIGKDHKSLYDELGMDHERLRPPVTGDRSRQGSSLAGLEAARAEAPDLVLIHDGARPFVDAPLVLGVLEALEEADGALPVMLVVDTIKRSLDGKSVGGTEDRSQLFAAQTPQGFRFARILAAHRKAIELTDSLTDDAAVAEWGNLRVDLANGNARNIKITLPEDFARAEQMLSEECPMETHVGHGYDIHAFEPGDAVILGNVRIPHTAKLKGHSDADVVLHALADALYGALGDGDIGVHFPPADERWKGADSSVFLADAVRRVSERSGRIVHLDATIVAEAPKMAPHVEAMRSKIASIAAISPSRVGLKATTNETLGALGRSEGIAAHAVATIELPRE